ncbi:glycosyltransferase 87 family protein [Dermatophilaceae bacterium Soc4.6]
MSRKRRAAAAAVRPAVLVAVAVAAVLGTRLPGRAVDLEVYRTAGAVWRAGRPLYGAGYPFGLGIYLPFTYPPFAALLLGLSSLLPSPVAVALVSSGSLLALGVAARLSAEAAGLARPWARWPLPVVAALGVLAVALEPVRFTLYFGQVNLVLMAAVTADTLVRRPRWPRGVLIGLAAAVKLTPLAFLLVLVCRHQWRACATAVVTFVAAHLLGAVLLPADSRDYWLGGVLTSPGRIGAADTATNQSLRGVLARAWPEAPSAVWVGLVLVMGVLTAVATWRRTHRGDDLGALLATAAGGLLVSPVSWTHHWVWVVPALAWLLARARRVSAAAHRLTWAGAAAWAVPALVAAVFVVAPADLLPAGDGREQHWVWWQHLIGDAYVWLGLAALVAASFAGPRPARQRTADEATTTSEASTQAVDGSAGTRIPR